MSQHTIAKTLATTQKEARENSSERQDITIRAGEAIGGKAERRSPKRQREPSKMHTSPLIPYDFNFHAHVPWCMIACE